jgi:hypothetical protein
MLKWEVRKSIIKCKCNFLITSEKTVLEIDSDIMSSMTRIYSFRKWKQMNAHGVPTLEGSLFTNIQVDVQQEGKQGTHWQVRE